ncbi:MAG: DUF2499 domain-containing protein [Cyanobacteria bacterium P01_H01_bin.130]
MHVLSFPTWMVHISSVIEWIAAIVLVWQFAEITGWGAWRSLSWGMLPALVSAMCACTWHFFDNAPVLEWLVTVQAATTLLGNATLCAAAWWIFKQSQSQSKVSRSPAAASSQEPSPDLTADPEG